MPQYPVIKISAFNSFYSKKRGEYVPGGRPIETDFYTEMDRIKSGYYAGIITELRDLVNEDDQKLFKKSKLPSFTTSALIKDWRDEKNVLQHSKLLNIDIDGGDNLHINDWSILRDKITDSIPVVAAFISARKNGLTFVVKIDPAKHTDTYEYIAWELHRTFGIFVDTSCKNITRLRFVSFDPEAFINYDFDHIPTVVPTEGYMNSIKKQPALSLLNVTKANSKELFENAIRHTEREYQFKDGSKYWYLIKIAGYCNSHGMDLDYCRNLVTETFSSLTSADIITPIEDIYKRYSHQFGSASFSESQLKSLREKLKINLYEELPEPPSVIKIDDLRFCTLGNFSLIIGKAKSRKTFFISMIAAAFIKGLPFQNKITRLFIENKTKIVVFDTEQGHYDVQLLAKKIMHLVGIESTDLIEIYHLRTINTKQRIEFIQEVIYNTPEICFCIIDGVRDLVFDINSPEEATEIAGKLMKWTEELNIHIMTILHQNKNDANGRGHVGTELTNKAESVLSVTRDQKQPEISLVVPEYFRGKEFNSFAFKINEAGLPIITDEAMVPQEDERGRSVINPNNIPDVKHKDILIKIFERNPTQKWAGIVTDIKLSFQEYGITFGDNKARDFFKYYVNRGWIIENLEKPIGEKYNLYSYYQSIS